ncbi:bifunctional folylpolyglutamate synthase/dihydrofolate synthase [Chitinophaga japonensis]|uniref:Dihydrofolate synthase/folylpolyglutamate synthase n=1 Tax=Chitinophaga japonensis TaxID=104662 RepID=A0A562T7H1_CHIJA|nr:folylpolyglutamate synthase/dihydrofolate synthase family protein [Chitinophaga japonensis]TWI89178.1 dihydrofolate synthase/folylpolyglutamate synthase [Chitinophaga japonensis]
MNYQQTVDYLYQHLPMFTRVGAAALKHDLHNTLELCKLLDDPQHKFKSVHVAGTNGKGSVSHMLAAVLQQAGYKTGLYTSPHLKDFRERIKVNGQLVPESFVVEFVEQMQGAITTLAPSFFELTVAMAFHYFALEQVDIAIIETGLGGRLDSTNVIAPEVSVITNISYDHMHILGDTLPVIAAEKAGIIKQGVPVVIGETQPEVRHVFLEKARAMEAPIHFADQEWLLQESSRSPTQPGAGLQLGLVYHGQDELKHIHLDLGGQYQEKNAMTVLSTIKALQQLRWNIPEPAVREGLSHVKKLTGLRGRWEVIDTHPLTVLDVGHNEAGITEIIQQLRHTVYQQLHIVTGFVKDKAVEAVLALLPVTATYYFCRAQIPRALDEHTLAALAARYGLQGHAYPSVQEALHAARQHAHKDDLILVCGSFFVVGEVI